MANNEDSKHVAVMNDRKNAARAGTPTDTRSELERHRDLLTTVTANTKALLAYMDRDFNFIWVNPAYAEADGRTQEELVGRNHFNLYHDEENEAIFRKVRDTGVPFEILEKPFVYPDNPERGTTYWNWTLSPIKDSSGVVHNLVLSLVDVTHDVLVRKEQNDLLQREQHIASMLQQALVPPSVPAEINGYRFAVTYKPALREAEIGGDFYDVFDLGDGRVCVIIGDVAGKGLRAAMRVAAARYAIRGCAFIETKPSRILALANESLCCGTEPENDMLTAFLAMIDTRVGTVVFSSAGHEPPVVLHPGGQVEELVGKGLPLGIMPGINYTEGTCRLNQGSRIVMVTDGITEARNPDVELFGKQRLIDYVKDNGRSMLQDVVDGLLQTATAHAGGELQDDAAIVVFEQYVG